MMKKMSKKAREINWDKMVEKIKESEERYRDLVEKAGVAILIDDKDGNVQYCNKKYEEMFGYALEEIGNQPIFSIVHPDDLKNVTKFHKSRIQGNKVPLEYECKGIKKMALSSTWKFTRTRFRITGILSGRVPPKCSPPNRL